MNTKTVVIWVIVLVVLGYAIYALTKNDGAEVLPEENATPAAEEAAVPAVEGTVEAVVE